MSWADSDEDAYLAWAEERAEDDHFATDPDEDFASDRAADRHERHMTRDW